MSLGGRTHLGTLALVGGGEWQEGCVFDSELLAISGASEVLVLPTAAAYEHPGRAVDSATRYFAGGRRRGPRPHGAQPARRQRR